MSLTYRTLKLNFTDGTGQPVKSGTVTLTPSQQLTDVIDGETVTPVDVIVHLGRYESDVSLLTTDNVNVSPQPWYWIIKGIPGKTATTASFQFPFGDGTPLDYSAVTTVVPAPPIGAFLSKFANLSDLTSIPAARANLGLGSAATHPSTDFDTAGAAAAAQAASDPAGSAATALTTAEAYTDTETARAEAAESLLAPKASPTFTGAPAAPTAGALNNSTRLATTAYADAAVGVETSRATTAEGTKAPLASPALTGNPTAPTQAALNNTTRLATTAYADGAVGVETSRATTAEGTKAPLASPALTGTPTAPTAAALDNTTKIATTAYTDSAVGVEASRAATAEALKAPLASPALTGTPTAPTATAGDSTTKLATTAFATTALGLVSGTCKSVLAFGADPTGATASDTAFANALTACVGSATPSTNTRQATAWLYIPAGIYKLTQDWVLQSVQGLIVKGDGRNVTKIVASGTGFTNAVINADGNYMCSYSDFTIQGDGTEAAGANPIPWAMQLTKTSGSNAVTTQSSFSRISILSFNWAGGFLQGAPVSTTNQVDGSTIRDMLVVGGGSSSFSFTTKWLVGFQCGNGSFGNQYNYVFNNCAFVGVQAGAWCNASGFEWYGGEPAANAVDYLVLPGAQVNIQGIQSQGSGRFIQETTGSSAVTTGSVRDCQFKSATAAANGKWVDIQAQARAWEFSNVLALVTNVTPIMAFNGGGNPEVITLVNVAQNNTFAAGITTVNSGTVCVLNYMQINSSGQLVTATTSIPGVPQSAQVSWVTTPGTTTYTVPAGATEIEVTLNAGGGGGGGGVLTASGAAGGGAGGNGGGYSYKTFVAADLGASVSLTVGAGGTGGAAASTRTDAGCGVTNGSATVTDASIVSADVGRGITSAAGITAGAFIVSVVNGVSFVMSAAYGSTTGSVSITLGGYSGLVGGQSVFGTAMHSNGGGPGSGGTASTAGVASVVGGTGSELWGGFGGAGSAAGAGVAGTGITTATAMLNGASGGGGGAGTTGAAASNGGATQIPILGAVGNTGSGGVAGGASPGAGTQPTIKGIPSCGGGGGASAFGAATTAQTGATAFNGGGGGGGGGCSAGSAAGSGGTGGAGFALVIAHFA